MSRSCDGIKAVELEAGDDAAAALETGCDLVFGETFAAKDSLKAAGLWFVKVNSFAGWARPEIAKQIRRIVEVAARHNLTAKVL
jgi:hypothetical protein